MPNILFLIASLSLAFLTWMLAQRLALAWTQAGAARPRVPWWGWLRLKAAWLRRRERAELSEQMPGLLEALSSGLRAGLSLPQAVDAAAEDLPEPSAALAQRLLAGLRLGQAPDALMLAEAAAQAGHPLAADWRLLATAVAIQRASGGDLAATLDQITETLRERQRLQAQVDALTAQGRLSAWVVGSLPVALLLALQVLDPDLVAPLFHTGTGWVLVGLGALLEAAGILLLRRIVDIEA